MDPIVSDLRAILMIFGFAAFPFALLFFLHWWKNMKNKEWQKIDYPYLASILILFGSIAIVIANAVPTP